MARSSAGKSTGRYAQSRHSSVLRSRKRRGAKVTLRAYRVPFSGWNSFNQTATPLPPAKGPHFLSGRRGSLFERFALVVAIGNLLSVMRRIRSQVPCQRQGENIATEPERSQEGFDGCGYSGQEARGRPLWGAGRQS